MAPRLASGKLDDQSWTVGLCRAAGVGLATTPETTILSLGCAMAGLSDVIAIHGRAWPRAWPAAVTAARAPMAARAPAAGLAAAGAAASHAAPSATATAVSRRHPRVILAPGVAADTPCRKCYCRSSAAV